MNFRKLLGSFRLTPADKQALAPIEPPQPVVMSEECFRDSAALKKPNCYVWYHTTIHCDNFHL